MKFGRGRQGGRGGAGGRRGVGRKGVRKRHPNFAARNRKIGKGGPTGRGAFAGLRRRRPTVPRPPDHSGSEPEDYQQDVDLKTGRTKRRQKPKSAEAEQKARQRREEDEVRKSGKKKRPGPKQKDSSAMKEKVKRFWRETPKPKGKKAPKFVADGLESERKAERRREPRDFNDLRMPSKKQLKKLEKERKKVVLRRHKKSERKNLNIKQDEHLIQGDYIPTLSEIEGVDGLDFMQQSKELDGNEMSSKLRLKLKPKKTNKRVGEYKTFSDEELIMGPISDKGMDYKLFAEQQEQFKKFKESIENPEKDVSYEFHQEYENNVYDNKYDTVRKSQHNMEFHKTHQADSSSDSDVLSEILYESENNRYDKKIDTLKKGQQNLEFDKSHKEDSSPEEDVSYNQEYENDGYGKKKDTDQISQQSLKFDKFHTEDFSSEEDVSYEINQEYGNNVNDEKDNTEQKNLQDLQFDETYKEDANLKSREDDSKAGQSDYWSNYRKNSLNLIKRRSKLFPVNKEYMQKLESLNLENNNDPLNGQEDTHVVETQNQENKISGYEDNHDIEGSFDKNEEFQRGEDFDRMYEDIKEYLDKETNNTDENNKGDVKPHNSASSESAEYETASGDYELWDSVQRRFRKPRRRLKTRSASIDMTVGDETIESKCTENITEEPMNISESLPKSKNVNRMSNEGRGQYTNQAKDKIAPESDFEKEWENMKSMLELTEEKLNKADLFVKNPKESSNVTDSKLKPINKLGYKTTGSVVDEKLEALYEEVKELADRKGKKGLIDEVGQLLFNDVEEMLPIEGESSFGDEDFEKGVNDSLNMKDYNNYEETLPETKVEGTPKHSSRETKVNEVHKEVERGDEESASGSSESSEDEKGSESEREEYDIALMAGLRTDRIRVYDENVSLYAHQDHQAKRFMTPETSAAPLSLSDQEYERARVNGELIGQKARDDDLLISTDTERSKYKIRKSYKKPPAGEKVISSRDEPKTDCKKDHIDSDRLLEDKSDDLFPQGISQGEKIEDYSLEDKHFFGSETSNIKYVDVLKSNGIWPSRKKLEETPEFSVHREKETPEDVNVHKIEEKDFAMSEKFEDLLAKEVIDSKSTSDISPTHVGGGDTLVDISNVDKPNTKTTDTSPPQKTTSIDEDIDIFGGEIEDIEDDDEEENKYKDDQFLKDEWRQFATNVKDSFGDEINFPLELPDDCPSEEDTPNESDEYDQTKTTIPHSKVSILSGTESAKDEQSNEQTSLSLPEQENVMSLEINNESREVKNVSGESSYVKNGINEYLEEDEWELWFKFVALMNNDQTRTYDTVAALFKAKKQEILTRTKTPIPPWKEPGLDDYEISRRKVQREWEKTERYYALNHQKDFNKFLRDNEGLPIDDGADPEVEDTYRTVFDLLNTKTEGYDHQAYKDSLSREELAEIYSGDEIEEELRFRERRKQAEYKESELRQTETSGDLSFPPLPPLDSPREQLESVFLNQPNREFSQYNTEPDWVKTDPTNPINYKIYSNKMDIEAKTANISQSNDQTEVIINEPISDRDSSDSVPKENDHLEKEENDGSKGSKGEQAKKMWQYFQQLMRERHEKNIEKFVSQYPVTKRNSEEEARFLWKQYVAFMSGAPLPKREDTPQQMKKPIDTQGEYLVNNDRLFTAPQQVPLFSQGPEEASTSKGWRTLMQRIELLKMNQKPPMYSPQQMATGKSQEEHQENLRKEPPPQRFQESRYNNGPPPPPPPQPQPAWGGAPTEQYRPPTTPYGTPGVYQQQQQQQQGHYTNQYSSSGQGYGEPTRRPPPGAPPAGTYYSPPLNNYNYPPPGPQQPRGLEGVSQYHSQFASQRGDYLDPYNRPTPPNVSINRACNSSEMGFQNPDFTNAMDNRNAYIANQADPYTANRTRVGWPGDHSDKFHNRKYFVSDMGGQQTYIPRDLSGQPGDHSDRYYNRSNFRNPNFSYRTDTYSRSPFEREPIDHNQRSTKWWQSGTRPFASSGLQSGPIIPENAAHDPYSTDVQGSPRFTQQQPRDDSSWAHQHFTGQNNIAGPPNPQSKTSVESENVQLEE